MHFQISSIASNFHGHLVSGLNTSCNSKSSPASKLRARKINPRSGYSQACVLIRTCLEAKSSSVQTTALPPPYSEDLKSVETSYMPRMRELFMGCAMWGGMGNNAYAMGSLPQIGEDDKTAILICVGVLVFEAVLTIWVTFNPRK
mmetsp:Transcript_34788/g.48234  ORF Transcript_34788/g.48234 Transcript_34788/m.48234 type:complete len:145 (-) Transcript_34788:33-467(-)